MMTPSQSTRLSAGKRLRSHSSSQAEIFVISDSETSDGSETFVETSHGDDQSRTGSQGSVIASSKRAAGSRKFTYRQPEIQMIAQVKTNAIWKLSKARLEDILWNTQQSAESRRHAELTLVKLLSDEAIWGKVVKSSGASSEGGPCAQCLKRKVDCVVMLEEVGDADSGTGTPYLVASRCIHCVSHKRACNIGLPVPTAPRARRVNKTASEPTMIPSVTPSTIPAATPVASEAVPTTHDHDQSPSPNKDQIIAALTDFTDFTNSMKEKASQGGVMDFQTKSMFRLVEQQIEVMRCFVDRS